MLDENEHAEIARLFRKGWRYAMSDEVSAKAVAKLPVKFFGKELGE